VLSLFQFSRPFLGVVSDCDSRWLGCRRGSATAVVAVCEPVKDLGGVMRYDARLGPCQPPADYNPPGADDAGCAVQRVLSGPAR